MGNAQCSDDCDNPVHAQRFFMTVSTHSDATVTSGLESDSVPSPIPVPRLNDVLTLLSLEHSLFPQIFERGIWSKDCGHLQGSERSEQAGFGVPLNRSARNEQNEQKRTD